MSKNMKYEKGRLRTATSTILDCKNCGHFAKHHDAYGCAQPDCECIGYKKRVAESVKSRYES